MRPLTLHPNLRCEAVTAIEAEAARNGSGLDVRYVLRGELDAVALPAIAAPERIDGLWRHSCFEAFVSAPDGRYVEFNLAPSTQWAAYRFDGYREGMRPAEVTARCIEVLRAPDRFELSAHLDLHGCELGDLDWRVGLTAVVEEADHRLSYWALEHPLGRPDFHTRDCFALELPASPRP
jgi:hypothetical protein